MRSERDVKIEEAAQIALIALDLDPENRPPQWTREQARDMLRSALAEAGEAWTPKVGDVVRGLDYDEEEGAVVTRISSEVHVDMLPHTPHGEGSYSEPGYYSFVRKAAPAELRAAGLEDATARAERAEAARLDGVPSHGIHGGPLVRIVAQYEDGSEYARSHSPSDEWRPVARPAPAASVAELRDAVVDTYACWMAPKMWGDDGAELAAAHEARSAACSALERALLAAKAKGGAS